MELDSPHNYLDKATMREKPHVIETISASNTPHTFADLKSPFMPV